jgi:hypothetical protein
MISKLKTDKSTNLTQVVEKVNQIARKLNTLVALREIETEERLAKKGIIKCVVDKPPTDKHDEGKCEEHKVERLTKKLANDYLDDMNAPPEKCSCEPPLQSPWDELRKVVFSYGMRETKPEDVLDYAKANFKSNEEIEKRYADKVKEIEAEVLEIRESEYDDGWDGAIEKVLSILKGEEA